MRPCVLCTSVVVASVLTAIPSAVAQQTRLTRDTFGEVGLLEMPSGHSAPDGQLAFTIGDVGPYQRFSLAFQVLPWLEGSFRYSHVPDYAGLHNDYDRSFGLKLHLVREGTILPDVAVGMRDFLGTGIYSSEYVVASKQIGNFDLTAGLGWGRLADSGTLPNPFGYVLRSFDTRTTVSTTGLLNLKQFFHGPRTGVFGGFAWQTPIDNLKLQVEYSSDQYLEERKFAGGLVTRSPVNVGLSYSPSDSVSLSAGWFYGTTYGFTVSFHGDPTTKAPSAMRLGPKVPPPVIRDTTEQQHALLTMLDVNAEVAAQMAGGPWVRVPSQAERARQDVMQALLSESRGVRDVDIHGTTLVIDARRLSDTQTQCAR